MATQKVAPKAVVADPLAAFFSDVTEISRENIQGTLAEFMKARDLEQVIVNQSTNFPGMFYAILRNGSTRTTIGFSKKLSQLVAKGEVKLGMLHECEVAIQENAAGEQRLKLQLPAGSSGLDITDIKQESFKRTFKLSDIQDLTDLAA